MPPLPPLPGAPGPARGSRGVSRGSPGRPQRYRRHPKPPYSYLALIALVIRAAPGRRLKLAQIIQQLRSLFPFFGGGYQGWKDSVRHNLSSNPCFAKVLKDPTKPQAKGNYWTVDVTQIPPAALKLQNTAVARGGGGGATPFVPDLSPFVLLGCPYPPSPTPSHSSFSIASLLRENPGIGDTKELGSSSPPTLPNPTWVPQKGSDTPQSRGTSPPILWGSQKGSEHSPPHGTSPPILWGSQKGSDPSSPQGTLPPILWGSQKGSDPAPFWGQLPTSYSTAVAPNAVAPPPHSGGTPFLALHWGVLPHPPPPRPPPHPEGDLGSPPPPNKSVFDVWLSHPGDIALRG